MVDAYTGTAGSRYRGFVAVDLASGGMAVVYSDAGDPLKPSAPDNRASVDTAAPRPRWFARYIEEFGRVMGAGPALY